MTIALRSLAHRSMSTPPTVQVLSPSAPLRAHVRAFEFHAAFEFGTAASLPVWPHPHEVMAIRIGAPLQLLDKRLNATRCVATNVLCGPVTWQHSAFLTCERRTSQFLILFQPGGLRRLFGLPACKVVDDAVAASYLLGPGVNALEEAVRSLQDPAQMAAAAEAFLLPRAAAASAPVPAERAALAQLLAHGRLSITQLRDHSGYGRYRFERQFIECLGVTPKLFARIVRFDHALRLRASAPTLNWTSISHDAGYYDQNHFVKEFKALTGQLPSEPHDPQWRIAGDALEPGYAAARRPAQVQGMHDPAYF